MVHIIWGCIKTNLAIFRGMNIHESQLFGVNRRVPRFWLIPIFREHCHLKRGLQYSYFPKHLWSGSISGPVQYHLLLDKTWWVNTSPVTSRISTCQSSPSPSFHGIWWYMFIYVRIFSHGFPHVVHGVFPLLQRGLASFDTSATFVAPKSISQWIWRGKVRPGRLGEMNGFMVYQIMIYTINGYGIYIYD